MVSSHPKLSVDVSSSPKTKVPSRWAPDVKSDDGDLGVSRWVWDGQFDLRGLEVLGRKSRSAVKQ